MVNSNNQNNPKAYENIKPYLFKKGQSGNPKGRPKKNVSILSLIKGMLPQEADFIGPYARPDDKTYERQIARAVLVECIKGNVPMIKELFERCYGRVTQPISGDKNEPIIIKVVHEP